MSGRLVHIGSAVVDYVYRIDALPAYISQERGGQGFVEIADRILSARSKTAKKG